MSESPIDILAQGQQGNIPPTRALSEKEMDQRFAAAMGENIEWLRAHEKDLLQQHPDWMDKFVVVAVRTPSKILAVAEDRNVALEEGMKSPELLDLARTEGMPPGTLLTPLLLGGSRNVWDW